MTRKLDETFLDVLLDEDTKPEHPGRGTVPSDELAIVYVDESVRDLPIAAIPHSAAKGTRPDDTAPFELIDPEQTEPLRRSGPRRKLLDRWEERTRIVDFETSDLIKISQRPELDR